MAPAESRDPAAALSADRISADAQPAQVAADPTTAAKASSGPDPSAAVNGGGGGAGDDGGPPMIMARRLSLVSWGDGSAPSMPAVDDGDLDEDSSTDMLRSTTTSLRSTMYDYVEENGRTYHRYKAGKYPLPNDLQEQARLDLQHALFILMAGGKSFLAPVENPKHVLDFATGTGIWAIELALQYPDCEVLGTDLSPIQPEFVPSNCHFEVEDAEDEWAFAQPFDLIHGRAIISCFRHPDAIFRSAFHSLKPGGYLEIKDPTFPVRFAGDPPPPGTPLQRWQELITEGAIKAGRPWADTTRYKEWFEEVGFEDVVERTFYWPIGTWPRGHYYKTLGAYVQQDLLHGLEALGLRLLGVLGWSVADIKALVADARKQVLDPKTHAYFEVITIHGRKPGGPPKAEKTEKTEKTEIAGSTEAM